MRNIDFDVTLKKYFWAVPVLVVIVCSALTAKAVNYYVAGKVLLPSDKAAPVPRSALRSRAKATKPVKSKDGTPLVARNMFCNDCEPPEPEVADDAPAPADGSVPQTSLPLELVASNVGTRPEYSFATIRNTGSDREGAYGIGSVIPDAGEIVEIRGKYVDFRNHSNRRVERINLLAKAPEPKTAVKAARATARRSKGARGELAALIDESVNKVDDNTYEIDRKLVDKITSNPAAVARGARVVPSIKNGKTVGFKLYAIRPSSVFAKIGLMNGDTLQSINNFELTSLDKGLEVYTKVREASNLTVEITRRGKPVTLSYRIK